MRNKPPVFTFLLFAFLLSVSFNPVLQEFFRISMEPESGSSSCGFLDFVVLERALVSKVVVMEDQGVIIRRGLFRCVT